MAQFWSNNYWHANYWGTEYWADVGSAASANYWSSGYWHPNYWDATYWANPVIITPVYWHPNYWGSTYWHPNYWANEATNTTTVSQSAAGTRTLAAFVPNVVIDTDIFPATATRTLSAFDPTTSADNTFTATTGSLTLAGINAQPDLAGYQEGSIDLSVYASSLFSFTEGANATLGTLNLTGNDAGIAVQSDVIVTVATTEALSLTALATSTSNPIVVQPGTAERSLSAYNAQTGIGTALTAGVGQRSLTGVQASVTGVNFDVGEVFARTGSRSLTGLSPDIAYDTVSRGGHFIPGLAGIRAGKKRKKSVREAARIVAETVSEVLEDEKREKPIQRVSRQRKAEIIDRSAEAFARENVFVGELAALERAAARMTTVALERRRKGMRDTDDDLILAAVSMML